MIIKQRSIVLIPFPFSDLSNQKKRPAFVVSSSRFNSTNEDVICCLITSNLKDKGYSISITNEDMESGNLAFDSKVKPYRLFTISKKLIYRNFGLLSIKKSKQIEKGIKKLVRIV